MNQPTVFNRPPAPPRETARTRQALSVRVDAGLVRAFYDTCDRLGIRHSEMMEIILWNALDKPTMSFEPGFLPRPKNRKHSEGDGE
jgi:antitoxin component of RelBE/YafQ-DinJ toxin-antitoxin module